MRQGGRDEKTQSTLSLQIADLTITVVCAVCLCPERDEYAMIHGADTKKKRFVQHKHP